MVKMSFSAASKGYKRYQTMNKGLAMYMLYKHKCSPYSVLRCALHVIRNDVENVTLDAGSNSYSPPSAKSSDIVVLPCKLVEL